MYRLNILYVQFYITVNKIWLYESDQNAVHAANLVANSGNTAYGVEVISCLLL